MTYPHRNVLRLSGPDSSGRQRPARRGLTRKTDFRPRWETKTVHLSNLRTVDFFTNYWGSTLICHTFVSFDFGPEGYVCISIETRMTKGQAYSAIAGLYRSSRSITSSATSATSCGCAPITGLKTCISIT
jgi:hypothetical protein